MHLPKPDKKRFSGGGCTAIKVNERCSTIGLTISEEIKVALSKNEIELFVSTKYSGMPT